MFFICLLDSPMPLAVFQALVNDVFFEHICISQLIYIWTQQGLWEKNENVICPYLCEGQEMGVSHTAVRSPSNRELDDETYEADKLGL